jgi:PAS domain S-box-containing protein
MPDRNLLAAEKEDLTRKLAEKHRALMECEARFEAIFNSSQTFTSLCTADGVVLDVSGPSLELGDVRIEDCVGLHIWEAPIYAGHPEEAAKVRDAVHRTADGPLRYESRVCAPNGEWRTFDVTARPVRAHLGGEIRFVVLEARDLTAERAAEDRARRAERMEALGLLTGGIAHDFNNFLTVVIGALEMVVRAPDRPNRHALVQAAFEAAQKAESLNKQLLAFARRAPIAAQQTDVAAALHELAPLLRKAVGESVEVHIHAQGECQRVNVEAAQFEAAILNLCVNARDAMPSGGSITIEARPADPDELALSDLARPALVVAVKDTGAGIPPDVLPRIFDPFFTTKGTGEGTGLGLSQVYGFAQQTGGTVEASSVPGQGSTFKLILPCTAAEPAAQETSAGGGSWCSVRSAILVEDDDSVCEIAAAMLHELGVEDVVTVAAGRDAQRVLETRSFDLLLTDVIMPGGLNGVELAEWARARRPDIKILLVSGWTADALTRNHADLPMLQKPFDLRALREAIRNLA